MDVVFRLEWVYGYEFNDERSKSIVTRLEADGGLLPKKFKLKTPYTGVEKEYFYIDVRTNLDVIKRLTLQVVGVKRSFSNIYESDRVASEDFDTILILVVKQIEDFKPKFNPAC